MDLWYTQLRHSWVKAQYVVFLEAVLGAQVEWSLRHFFLWSVKRGSVLFSFHITFRISECNCFWSCGVSDEYVSRYNRATRSSDTDDATYEEFGHVVVLSCSLYLYHSRKFLQRELAAAAPLHNRCVRADWSSNWPRSGLFFVFLLMKVLSTVGEFPYL